jgi:hypothetical protein
VQQRLQQQILVRLTLWEEYKMPLPQLNTGGNELSNTLKYLSNSFDEREDRKKQNTLFELQKKKLEHELSPEMQEALKADKKLQQANENALLTQRRLANNQAAASQIKDSLGAIDLDDSSGKSYKNFYDRLASNPLLKDHVAILPNPEDYFKTDISATGERVVPKENVLKLKGIIGSLMNASDRVAKGLTAEYKPVYYPDGTSAMVGVPKIVEPGQVLSAEAITGVKGSSFTAFKDKDDAGKNVSTVTVKEKDKAGNTVENVYSVNKVTGKKVLIAGGGEAFKPEGTKEITPQQAVENKRKARERLTELEGMIFGKSEAGDMYAADQAGTQGYVDEYNELAAELGRKSQIVWSDEDVVVKPGTVWDSKMPGFVKTTEKVKTKPSSEVVENPTEDQVKKMKAGTKFTLNGKVYVRQ